VGVSPPEKGTSRNCFWQGLGASWILPKAAPAIATIMEIYEYKMKPSFGGDYGDFG